MSAGTIHNYFTPMANEPPTSNFATLDTRNAIPVLDFDASLDEGAVFEGRLDGSYAGGGLAVDINFMASSSTSNNVVWGVSFERIQTGTLARGTDSFATEKTATVAKTGASSDVEATGTITFSNSEIDGLLAGERYRVKVRRIGSSVSDTMAGDAELTSVFVREV